MEEFVETQCFATHSFAFLLSSARRKALRLYDKSKILEQSVKGDVANFRAVTYIPIWFHIVSKTDGTSAVSEGSILDMLCDMNKIYTNNATDMQFYLKGFNYIKSDELYGTTRTSNAYTIMKADKKLKIFQINQHFTL